MPESTTLIAHLRHVAGGSDSVYAPPRQGDGRSDDAWRCEGLAKAQLHEIHAEDAACAAGFAIALALAAGATPILWLRSEAAERQGGRLHATGLVEMGLAPDRLVLALVADDAALLRAAADGARCAGLGTLVVEAWGRCPGIDLTATRRLMLAAERSGVTVLMLRVGGQPVPSAAATRWGVAAVPSIPLDAGAPGLPAFDIELQRRRGGPSGRRWRVEWNRDACRFDTAPDIPLPDILAPDIREDTPALSGAGLSLAGGGAAAQRPPASVRRA
ncbi:MAG TPA: hypothetical protein VFQ57_03940 [Sphingomonas sp.]|jgi:protein ImuA|nr:hypothetical protein [Sphingomonas sp.]